MKSKIISWVFVTVFSLVVIRNSAATNGVLRDGVGARSQGLGGAFTAISDDAIGAIYYNPAGIAFGHGNTLDMELSFIDIEANFKNANNDQNLKGAPLFFPDIGFVIKSKDSPFAWGLGLITVAGLAAEWRLDDVPGPAAVGAPDYGEAVKNKALLGLTRIAPALAYQVSPQLSIGGSFGPAYQIYNMEGFFTFQTHPIFTNYTALADADMTGWGWGGNVGVLYKVNDKLNIGLSYTTETKTSLKGDVDFDLSQQLIAAGLTGLVPDPTAHYDAELDFTFPQTVNLGAAYKLSPTLLIALDLGWINWSRSFDELFFRFKHGDNAGVNTLLGSTEVKDTLPLKWRDRIVMHWGLEYYLSERTTLRAGYSFGKSPVPDETVMPLMAAISEQAITLGYGHKMGNWKLNVAYQYDFPHKQSVGTSRILGLDFDNSSVKISQHWLGITLSNDF